MSYPTPQTVTSLDITSYFLPLVYYGINKYLGSNG